MAWEAPFDPFDALGLERDASPKIIKSRYHELARRYHPNRNQGPDDSKAGLSEHFHHLHEAWQLLCKQDRRRRCIERLDLFDQQEIVLATVADLLSSIEQPDQRSPHHKASTDGHVSSDADEDDLPRVAGIRRRTTFDRPTNGPALDDIEEGSDSPERNAQIPRLEKSRIAQLSSKAGSGRDDEGSDHNTSALRRKKFDMLRKKEFEAFTRYHDAMIEKFSAEEVAEKHREEFEQAKWRREYFERAPRETSQRVRLLKLFNRATKAFASQQLSRRRNRSTVSYGGQILSTGDPLENNQFLNLPSRMKSTHRRGWSSDISGDQTSSDENSSEKATSPTRSPRHSTRPVSPRAKHRRWDSLPNVIAVAPHCLPNGNHDPISPITGPGPKVFIRTPTNLNEAFGILGSDADSASASSRSPSPQPTRFDSNRFTLIPSTKMSDVLGNGSDRRSRSPGGELRSTLTIEPGSGSHTPVVEVCQFKIKQIGHLQVQNIPMGHVHNLTYEEKQWMLGVEPDADNDPVELLQHLSKLDKRVAGRFEVKPDIKAKFNFRLIYSHREVMKQQHQTFIALSYRRKLHVEKEHHHFTLPLDPEIFQAVWDERQSDTEGVWIDQICIDGDSEEEKTISMSAMDMVYRSARLVVVALDDIELEASEGTILESHMDEFDHQVHVPANKRFRRRPTPYLESHDDLYMVIRKMMRSSWFRRAWCRHEMRLAREHIFLVPCRIPGSSLGKSVLRFTGKCLTHFLGLATEVPFEPSIESVKPALYAFFRDRSKLPAHEHHLRAHHGNFSTVVAEVFGMEAGGDPRIPEEQRAADARKDQISIILNTMECGLTLRKSVRDPSISLPTPECHYMLLLLALAARDPGALSSVGHPMRQLPFDTSTWLFEPTNVDSGLNNYRTLNRLPADYSIVTHSQDREHFVQLDLKFLTPGDILHALESPDSLKLAQHFTQVCETRKLGRNRKRYLINDKTANRLFGSMHDVYAETLACVFECGPDWMTDVCQRYGVSRWKHDLEPARELLIALKNTNGRWPDHAWSSQATGFIMDFVNFLIIRGMPQRQITQNEHWRPIWVPTATNGKVLTFIPPGDIRVAVPAALLDQDYIHLARLWVLESRSVYREGGLLTPSEWTLLGKSVIFSDDTTIEQLELSDGITGAQKVFGRKVPHTPDFLRRSDWLRP